MERDMGESPVDPVESKFSRDKVALYIRQLGEV